MADWDLVKNEVTVQEEDAFAISSFYGARDSMERDGGRTAFVTENTLTRSSSSIDPVYKKYGELYYDGYSLYREEGMH